VRSEPFADNARYHEQHDEIRGDRAEPYIEGPEWREERNDSVDDVRSLRQDLGHDMDDEERQSAE
jgi:hypothetical protein